MEIVNLDHILSSLDPTMNEGEFIFCTFGGYKSNLLEKSIMFFREKEGYTYILPKDIADKLNVEYAYIAAWITLEVHSSLQAVGLTAIFSTALAKANISCNVVAGYYHDHIFVNFSDRYKAIEVLLSLKK